MIDPWQHPTGKAPSVVSLICLGPSRNSYLAATLESDLSDTILGTDETWTLNRGGLAFSHDLLFVMDHLGGEADRYPRYGAALWQHDKPIITSDNCDGWPAHVHRYPILEIWGWLRKTVNPMHGDWFTNSVAYILVYAAFIGVKEIRVFGADYTNHHSGVVEDGHPCVAYWTGKLESIGLLVRPCSDSAFLNANQRDWIYGYRDDPRTIPANRARFRAMVGLEAAPESVALLSGERQVAELLEDIQPDHRYRYEWAKEKAYGKLFDIGGGIGYGAAILATKPAVKFILMLERSAASIAYARKNYPNRKIDYVEIDFDGKPIDYIGQADFAIAFEIIEHLAKPLPFLSSLEAGQLLASVPNERVVPYSPATAPFHQRHYTKQEFEDLLTQAGWEIEGWYGQLDAFSPVISYREDCRTLIVEARRCDLLNGKGSNG